MGRGNSTSRIGADAWVDALSDVLEVSRLAGRVLCQTEAVAPWGIEVETVPEMMLHVVLEGSCWLRIAGESPIHLTRGDVAILPRGGAHQIGDTPQTPTIPLAAWRQRRDTAGQVVLRGGARLGVRTRILCGAYTLDEDLADTIVAILPPVLLARPGYDDGAGALPALVQLIGRELASSDVGTSAVLARLLDVLFVQVLRTWLDGGEAPTSWLAAMRDAEVGRALALLHRQPEKSWTVDTLARGAGLSRAALARRFSERVGMAPLAYLTNLRMARAARLLTTTELSLAEIAGAVGYASEFAFSRAFRRGRGMAPGQYRRRKPSE